MKKLIFILISVFLVKCDFVDDFAQIKKTGEELSKTYNCGLSVENDVTNGKKKLIVQLNGDSDEFFPGKILLDFYSKLRAKKIKHDVYIIKDGSNRERFNINSDEVQNILNRKKIFDKNSSFLSSGNYHKFYAHLNSELRSKYPYEELTKNFDNILVQEYPYFDGFIFSDFEGEEYIMFRKSNKGKYILISLKLNDKSSIMYGYGME